MDMCEKKDCEDATFQQVLMSNYCWQAIEHGKCRRIRKTEVKGL